jgi:hypothetical protein
MRMRVAVGVVLAQEVAAEVAGQVVPDAVDVVGVVLGIVVFDQRDRAVQAPVVGMSASSGPPQAKWTASTQAWRARSRSAASRVLG